MKRYDIKFTGTYPIAEMAEHPNGKYVALADHADRVKQLEEEIEELDFLLNEGDALGKAERRASVLEKALSELIAANDAVQEALCDGPDVPDFDPLALGKAQQRVTQAEDKARVLLNGGSNEPE